MGLFGPAKGSIGQTIKEKNAGIEKTRGRSASQIQAQKAKARKKEIKEEAERKKQEERDIKRYKALRTPVTDPAKIKKQKKKAIAAGEKRREKAAERKARRKAKGFWG